MGMFIGYTNKTGKREIYSDSEGNHEFDSSRAAMVEMSRLVARGVTDAAWLCDDDGRILASVALDWHRRSYTVTPPIAVKSGYRVDVPAAAPIEPVAARYVGQRG